MIKMYFLFILVFVSAVLFNACKDSSTDPEPPGTTENYFPNNNGNYYKYNTEVTDSAQTRRTGTRSSTYQGTQVKNGTSYQAQIDSITIAGQTFTNVSYFRKNDSQEVLFYLDTTGLAANIPAEYQSLLALAQIDADMKLFSPTFESATSWPVFKISVLTQNVIQITANYDGMEPVTFGSETKNAAKIRYVLRLALPGTAATEYTAYGWFVADVGVAKWQGNGLILGAFSGNGIDFADTSSIFSQTLIQYNLK